MMPNTKAINGYFGGYDLARQESKELSGPELEWFVGYRGQERGPIRKVFDSLFEPVRKTAYRDELSDRLRIEI
jgi:hypothetical protein